MPYKFSPDVQLLLDALEAVTYTSVNDDDGDTDVSVGHAMRNNVSAREVSASLGRYQSGDVSWEFRESELSGVTPKPGDYVTDAGGTRYTVLDAMADDWANFVRVTSRNLKIAEGLRHSVDWYEPSPTQSADDAGHREPTFVPRRLGLACRVQETGRNPVEAMGKRVTVVTYDVILERRIEPTHEGQLRWTPAGEPQRILEITGATDPDRIDALQRLSCVWRGD